MREVCVIGVGMNKWGELWDKSIRDLFVESALLAIKDAGVDKIDSMYVGCMTSGLFVGQEHLASLLADYLGRTPISSTRVESACASGGLAVRCGFIEVASGLATAADQEYEVFHGATFPGLYALMAKRHMHEFGTTRDMLSAVAVKNHDNGSKNPLAQFQSKTTLEGVARSVMVAEPLTLMDCSPITDGSACVILASVDKARELSKNPLVKILGVGNATDRIALHSRKSLTTLNATVEASKRAYTMAGKTPKDIDFAEVHDCFTIAEIIVSEDLGFFEKGKGGHAALEGKTALNGEKPINTSGGLKSKGHPVGATGVGQIVEVVKQLRGEAGERQLKNTKVGLTQNMGGSGGSAVVHILEVM